MTEQLEGMSSQAKSLIIDSLAPGTRKQYRSALRAWDLYCQDTATPNRPSPISVVNYLSTLTESKAFSTIATHKAAICFLADQHYKVSPPLRDDNLIRRLMRGLFRRKPPGARYSHTWDPTLVLNYLAGLGRNEDLPLELLTHKLATLLALCSPQRVSELSILSLEHLRFDRNGMTFFINTRNKNRRSGPPKEAVFESHPERHEVCPIACINAYLVATMDHRRTQYLLTNINNGEAVKATTTAGWIRSVLQKAGIPTSFKAHSVRSASTSKAFAKGLPLPTIIRAANWATDSTFFTHYCRERSFQSAILS